MGISESLQRQSDFYQTNDPSIPARPVEPYVIEVSFAGNAVYVETDPADYTIDEAREIALQIVEDHIGHDYAGIRETYPTDNGNLMIVLDRH